MYKQYLFQLLSILACLISLDINAQKTTETESAIRELIKQGEVDSAMVIVNEIISSQSVRDLTRAAAYFSRGLIHYHNQDFNKAIADQKEAIRISDDKYPNLTYRARSRLASNYERKFEMDSSKMHLDILLENEKYSDSLSLTYTYYGVYCYYYRGVNRDVALEYIQKARDIASALGMHKRAASFDVYIGDLYGRIDNDSLSLIYHNKGLKYLIDNDHLIEASYVYLDRGSYFNGKEKWDLAEKDLLECIRISKEKDIPSNIANANQFLSSTYANTGRYKEAIEAIDISMEICDQYDIEVCRVFAYMYYTSAYHKAGDYQKAIKYGELLISYPLEDYIDEINTGYGYLAQSYSASGYYDKAYAALEQERILTDSLFNIEKQESLGKLREEYEREKNLVEITRLNSINELETLRRKGLTWGLCIFGLLTFLVFNREIKRRKNAKRLHEIQINLRQLEATKLKEEIQYKNRELSTKALHIAKKNELLESMRTELEKLSEEEGSKACVRKVVNSLKLESAIDQNWTQFMDQFTNLNPNFYKELINQFPDLSKSDLRLAALIRMNQNSKEIASMLNISQIGIKKARQRIRKKLQLDPKDSLETFILNI